MNKLLALLSLILVGCSTPVPVRPVFPTVPDTIKQPCDTLDHVPENSSLSDAAKVITTNYSKYHQCSLKNDAWAEWYDTQKKIFEGIK